MHSSPLDDIFTGTTIKSKSLAKQGQSGTPTYQGHDISAIKTYRYLRIGMLVAVIALAASILEEFLKPGVGCFMGSISGYFYTPVHSVFIGVMVVIGVALIVIKGKTALEDTFLSLAGMMSFIVAFLPTTDDPNGDCRKQLLGVHDYLPQVAPYSAFSGLSPKVHELLSKLDPRFSGSSIRNNLHTLVWAGIAAIGLVLIGWVFQRLRNKAPVSEYTRGFWVNLVLAGVVVLGAGLLELFAYPWVLQQHAKAAALMFVFLAGAGATNWWVARKMARRERNYGRVYGGVAILMLVAGALFAIDYEWGNRSLLGGHLVITIEAIEIGLFFFYWAIQTVDRWTETV